MHKEFRNKKVLITGGTGPFGRAFLKYLQLLKFKKPKKIVIYARD